MTFLTFFLAEVRCLLKQDEKSAEKLRKEMKMNDKLFWWTKIKALCRCSDFNELER